MDYKDTLLLPNTKFPMRGNLPQNEPKRYTEWFEKRDVYEKMKRKRKGKKLFTLHDGPPYANGHIHIGHALNKILKDIIVKSHYFFGDDVRFVPGWDCHGLPIEQQVEKKLGTQKKEQLDKTKIRELCREHAKKFVKIQKDEFKSLGVVADWKNPYLTMKYKFEADIYRTLCQIAKKGYLVQRSKPVYWSWAAKTALAEAEVEYEEKEDYSIFVAFRLDENASKLLDTKDASLIIWTTTPWTLPANVGISLNPDEKYVLTSDNFIVAKARYEAMIEESVIQGDIKKEFDSTLLENSFAINPLNQRKSQIILGSHVLMDGGTGLVHTAPGHGEDDYKVGLKYNLEVIMPVDDGGHYDKTIVTKKLLPNPEKFVGMHIFKSNEPILELLGTNLLKVEKFKHSYPFCWRTHKPLIYRATNQWFIAVDIKQDNKSLREITKEQIENISFYPAIAKNRLSSMLENRPDWCISRQRDWGVPIAFFKDKTTKEVILDDKVLNFLAMIFEQKGSDAWYELEIKDLLYPGSGLNPDNLEKIDDILDVWFDSGSTWQAVLKSQEYDAGNYPADIYLEGSDQHRGWFQSSLTISSAINNISPFKSLLTHGFTNDANGEKMSKSKGNVISPKDVSKKYGVEILRLWVGMVDYMGDQKISDDILKQISEQYRKTRNTIRFLLANINDLEEILPQDKLSEIDKWIVNKAKDVFDYVESQFKIYEFSKGLSALNSFISSELSGIHMDISKDRLYCNKQDDMIRRSAQSAMAIVTKSMLALLAPVLTYTVDEVFEYAPKIIKGDYEDVFDITYEVIDKSETIFDEAFMLEAREKFYEIIDLLKKEKKIKTTLELEINTTSKEVLKLTEEDREDWFSVSNIIETDTNENHLASFEVNSQTFKILKSNRAKCPRCWKHKSNTEGELCKRCQKVLNDA